MPENKKKAVCGQQSFVPLSQSFYGFLLEPYLETIRSKRARVEYRRHIHSVCAYFYRIRGSRFSFEQLSEADAKEYFLMYLTGKCNAGELSSDTYKLRLSVCRNFAFFLEKRIPTLAGEPAWDGPDTYTSAFSKLSVSITKPNINTDHILTDAQISEALSAAYTCDMTLFCIFALSFRMYLPQRTILSLRKRQFDFIHDTGRSVCILTYEEKEKQVYKRLPADLVPIMETYVESCKDYLFVNKYGNPMSPVNLSHRLRKFEKDTGCHIKIGQLRGRGIIDLVAHNPGNIDEVSDFTGLTKRMLQGYGEAMERIENRCVADSSGYCISIHREESEV